MVTCQGELILETMLKNKISSCNQISVYFHDRPVVEKSKSFVLSSFFIELTSKSFSIYGLSIHFFSTAPYGILFRVEIFPNFCFLSLVQFVNITHPKTNEQNEIRTPAYITTLWNDREVIPLHYFLVLNLYQQIRNLQSWTWCLMEKRFLSKFSLRNGIFQKRCLETGILSELYLFQ